MRVTQFTVSYERRASDGNYGGACASASETIELEDGDDPDLALSLALERMRSHVLTELSQSESAPVRRAVATGALSPPPDDDEVPF